MSGRMLSAIEANVPAVPRQDFVGAGGVCVGDDDEAPCVSG